MGAWGILERQSDYGLDLLGTIVGTQLKAVDFAICTIYVRVTGHDGEVYENSRYMECFDTTPPTLRASVSGDVLKGGGR